MRAGCGSSAWRESLGARGTPCAPGDRRRARRHRGTDLRTSGRARTRRERPDRTAGCTARPRARVLACSARLHASRVCAPRVLACSARLHALRVCALALLRSWRTPARLTGTSLWRATGAIRRTRRVQERATYSD